MFSKALKSSQTFAKSNTASRVAQRRASTRTNFTTLTEILEVSSKKYGPKNFMGSRNADGTFTYVTYQDFALRAAEFRTNLKKMGIGQDSSVALISNNRVEWAIAAYATYGLGGRIVPMYEKQNPNEWKYIVEDSNSTVVVAANDKITQIAREFKPVKHVITIDAPETDTTSFKALLKESANSPTASVSVDPSMLSGLIYTSGTTGVPKGVELSHRNIVSNVNEILGIFGEWLNDQSNSLNFLPWAHIYGQTCELHAGLGAGSTISLSSIENLSADLGVVKPSLLISVPVLFNKGYNGIMTRFNGPAAKPIEKKLFQSAMKVATDRLREIDEKGRVSFFTQTKYNLFDRLVFSKIRDRFGGRVRLAISGGAALSEEVQTFFNKIGLCLLEGYGLTETAPLLAVQSYGLTRKQQGFLRAIPGVDLKCRNANGDWVAIEEEGELCAAGPNIMRGYHNKPDATASCLFEKDGKIWFATGDAARIKTDGSVRITGRVKEQYKLTNGKYCVPTVIEDAMKLSPYVLQAFVYGDNLPHNVALIVPEFNAVKAFLKQRGIPSKDSPAEIVQQPEVFQLFVDELRSVSRHMKNYEIPRAFKLLSSEFSTANDLLTPKLSVKRRNVQNLYKEDLKHLYNIPVHEQISFHGQEEKNVSEL